MFRWLFGKKEVNRLKEETKKSFDSVKRDISSVSGWIKHLDSEKNLHRKEIDGLKDILSTIKEDLEDLKNKIEMLQGINRSRVFKTPKQVFKEQTGVYAVQTGVQTGVQTPNLSQFSVTERAIIWILLNSELKFSYDDLAVMLGKEKSTIRGQINAIKQKSEGLIEEITEKNGKKRVFISEKNKGKIVKKTKVRVKSN